MPPTAYRLPPTADSTLSHVCLKAKVRKMCLEDLSQLEIESKAIHSGNKTERKG